MALPVWAIMAGIQAGTSALKYATRKKKPSFKGTTYGKYLQRTGEEGRFSPAARRGIIGQISSSAGNIAGQERARTRGILEARGMGGSIAGIGKLAEPGLERQRIVAGASERLGIENELSKQQAREEYARLDTNSQMQRYAEAQQAIGDLVGGLTGAGMTGITEYLGQLEYEELLEIYKQLLGDDGGQRAGGIRGGAQLPPMMTPGQGRYG